MNTIKIFIKKHTLEIFLCSVILLFVYMVFSSPTVKIKLNEIHDGNKELRSE